MLILTLKKSIKRAIYQHLSSCEHCNHIVDLFRLQNDTFHLNKFNIHQKRDSTTATDRAGNWHVLLFKEA